VQATLIGDVHANLPVLEAVLDRARQRKVETISSVGDFLGYGAFPIDPVPDTRPREGSRLGG
jgi:hypothetical protein